MKTLETWLNSTTQMTKTKAVQMQRFECLQAKQHLAPQLDKDKLVESLSTRKLTEKEKDILSLELNFAITPRQIPALKIIAATDLTATQLDKETAQLLRHRVGFILSTANLPRSNLTRHCEPDDRNIVILPMDKRKCNSHSGPNGLCDKDGEPPG